MGRFLSNEDTKFLYQGVYDHFKSLILSHELSPGTKLPSLRKTCQEFSLSRTTVEAAYNMLSADGYCIARPGSGYYVTQTVDRRIPENPKPTTQRPIRYNLSSTGVDRSHFRLDHWRRYVKNALRNEERLLSYGQPQGEEDLRSALCSYLSRSRNILCSPEEIVVGAGTGSLLQILCPLLKGERQSVSLPRKDFSHQSRIFQDFGFQVHYRDKDADILYVSPARMTKWGEVMPISRRMEITEYARNKGRLILEDDYENEFVYSSQPTPSLYTLGGGEGVVYLGTFSRLLLPSIPLSFMVLPPSLLTLYQERMSFYHQTASKAEQIALAQYLQDGKLELGRKVQKRLYQQKLQALRTACQQYFPKDQILSGPGGTTLALLLAWEGEAPSLIDAFSQEGILVRASPSDQEGSLLVLLCVSSLPMEDIAPGVSALWETYERLRGARR